MATTLGQVAATISLDAKRWQRGANRAVQSNKKLQRSAYAMGRRIDRTTRSFGAAASRFKGLAVAGLALATGFALISRRAIQATDELSKMSRRLDISVEFLQSLQFAADSYNISQTQITRGFNKFRAELAAISSGVYSEAETYIRRLDSGLLDLIVSADSTEESLKLLFNTLRNADKDKSLAILNLLFSKRAGSAIFQLLTESPEGFNTFVDRAKELNGLTTETG